MAFLCDPANKNAGSSIGFGCSSTSGSQHPGALCLEKWRSKRIWISPKVRRKDGRRKREQRMHSQPEILREHVLYYLYVTVSLSLFDEGRTGSFGSLILAQDASMQALLALLQRQNQAALLCSNLTLNIMSL